MNRNRYPVSTMCRFFGVSRSGYYDDIKRMDQPAHDTALAEIIRKIGTTQTVNLVLDTIRLAMQKEKKVAAELQLHSDQGSQYTSQAYFDLTKEYGIIPSMSRRGNCYDNAMAENFFSILKTECIYRHQGTTFEDARTLIDNYIYFYNNQRTPLKTGVAPLTLRYSA